jgi:hypothetical protein
MTLMGCTTTSSTDSIQSTGNTTSITGQQQSEGTQWNWARLIFVDGSVPKEQEFWRGGWGTTKDIEPGRRVLTFELSSRYGASMWTGLSWYNTWVDIPVELKANTAYRAVYKGGSAPSSKGSLKIIESNTNAVVFEMESPGLSSVTYLRSTLILEVFGVKYDQNTSSESMQMQERQGGLDARSGRTTPIFLMRMKREDNWLCLA